MDGLDKIKDKDEDDLFSSWIVFNEIFLLCLSDHEFYCFFPVNKHYILRQNKLVQYSVIVL